MKRIKFIVGLIIVIAGGAYYVFLVPLRGPPIGVTFSQRGYQTNANGQTIPAYSISNGSPYAIYASAGTSIQTSPRHMILNVSATETLKPGTETIVSILPVSPARAVVLCQHVYSESFFGRASWLLDVYILKKRVVERVYVSDSL